MRFGSWMVTTSPRAMPMRAQELGAALDLVLELAIGDAAGRIGEHLAVGMRSAGAARISKNVWSRPQPARLVTLGQLRLTISG